MKLLSFSLEEVSDERIEVILLILSFLIGIVFLSSIWIVNNSKVLLRDDFYIHLDYARNLIYCHTLGFNCGEYSSGWSSPLYMFLLIPLALTFGPVPSRSITVIYGWMLNILLYILSSTVLYKLLRLKLPRTESFLFSIAVLASPGLLYSLSQGMETLLMFLLTVGFVYTLLKNNIRHAYMLAILGSFTRYEFAVFLLIFSILLYVFSRNKQHLFFFIIGATPLVLIGSINWIFTGTPIPSSSLSKTYVPYKVPEFPVLRTVFLLAIIIGIFFYYLIENPTKNKEKVVPFLLIATALIFYLLPIVRSHLLSPFISIPFSSRYTVAGDVIISVFLGSLIINELAKRIKNFSLYFFVLMILLLPASFVLVSHFFPCYNPYFWTSTGYYRHYIIATVVKSFVEEHNLTKIGVSDVGYIKLLLPDTYVLDLKGVNSTKAILLKYNEIRDNRLSCYDSVGFYVPEKLVNYSKDNNINIWVISDSSHWYNDNCLYPFHDNNTFEIIKIVPSYNDCSKEEMKRWLLIKLRGN